jgi:hypothetical protein
MEIQMDKVKLNVSIPEYKTIEYNGSKIEVLSFLGAPEQAFLINRYIQEYFTPETKVIDGSDYDYFGAELSFRNYVFQGATNIDTTTPPLDNNLYVDDALWGLVIQEISNYESFRYRLDCIVEEIKGQLVLKNSVGTVLAGLADKIQPLLENLANISPEEIARLQESGSELAKKLEESSLIKEATITAPAVVEATEETGKKVQK